MEACVVVCRTAKPADRRGRILFIDAKAEVTRERAQSFLTEEHTRKIVDAERTFAGVPGFARVATLDEVRAKGSNLSIPLYVPPLVGGTNGDSDVTAAQQLAATITAWQESSFALRSSMDELFATLEEAGVGR